MKLLYCFIPTDMLLPSCGHCSLLLLGGKQAEVGFLQPLQNQSEEQIYTPTSKSHPKDMHFCVVEGEGKPLPDASCRSFLLEGWSWKEHWPMYPLASTSSVGQTHFRGLAEGRTAVLTAACSTATMLLRTFLLSLLCCRVLKCNLREMTAAA